VLAGGSGERLASMIRSRFESSMPKQFVALGGDRSLLAATMERIAPLVPAERTVVVVPERYARIATEQLHGFRGVDIVAQPTNAGTAPGLLLPLSRVLARTTDPTARVAVFPSDHHVRDAAPLLAGVRHAAAIVSEYCELALLGVRPEIPATDYGWIVPGRRLDATSDAHAVERFVEKPDAETAERLFAAGALWNTFICVGCAGSLRELARRFMRRAALLFEGYTRSVGTRAEHDVLRDVYAALAPADFCRSVLEKAHALAVVPVDGTGWSDWGTPERVLRGLAETGAR
jgi:mannose-1-phosphate guanylyltransferase